MKRFQTSVSVLLKIWESEYGALSASYQRKFLSNETAQEIAKFDHMLIEQVIKQKKIKYLQDILKYLELQTRWEDKKRVIRGQGFERRESWQGTISNPCGHRYDCTCLDAFSVLRLAGRAA